MDSILFILTLNNLLNTSVYLWQNFQENFTFSSESSVCVSILPYFKLTLHSQKAFLHAFHYWIISMYSMLLAKCFYFYFFQYIIHTTYSHFYSFFHSVSGANSLCILGGIHHWLFPILRKHMEKNSKKKKIKKIPAVNFPKTGLCSICSPWNFLLMKILTLCLLFLENNIK